MGRIVVTEFISLDGVMEDPGGSEKFERGGWVFEISQGEEGGKFKLDETMNAEAQLLGRKTYEGFAEAWPAARRRVRRQLQQHAQVRHLLDARARGLEQLDGAGGDVADEVSKLRDELAGDIVVHGSARLVQTLIENDLVDELRLMVFPVVLGSGKRLFGETSGKRRMSSPSRGRSATASRSPSTARRARFVRA